MDPASLVAEQVEAAWVSAWAAIGQVVGAFAALFVSLWIAYQAARREREAERASVKRAEEAEAKAVARAEAAERRAEERIEQARRADRNQRIDHFIELARQAILRLGERAEDLTSKNQGAVFKGGALDLLALKTLRAALEHQMPGVWEPRLLAALVDLQSAAEPVQPPPSSSLAGEPRSAMGNRVTARMDELWDLIARLEKLKIPEDE